MNTRMKGIELDSDTMLKILTQKLKLLGEERPRVYKEHIKHIIKRYEIF